MHRVPREEVAERQAGSGTSLPEGRAGRGPDRDGDIDDLTAGRAPTSPGPVQSGQPPRPAEASSGLRSFREPPAHGRSQTMTKLREVAVASPFVTAWPAGRPRTMSPRRRRVRARAEAIFGVAGSRRRFLVDRLRITRIVSSASGARVGPTAPPRGIRKTRCPQWRPQWMRATVYTVTHVHPRSASSALRAAMSPTG